MALMTMAERDVTSSTSLLPVVGAHRKLNGHCASATSDNSVSETSFGRGDVNVPGAIHGSTSGATSGSVVRVCVPPTSQVRDDMESAAAADINRLDIYLDTKGSADDSSRRPVVVQHGGFSKADGSPTTATSLLATGSRPAYVRVTDNSSLPPEVEQLRLDCVTSASFSTDTQESTDKYALWEFVACAALLSLVVPFCGIPALIFSLRSQSSYRQGDVAASRASNLTALRLITVGGVCLCGLAIAASVFIAVFTHDSAPAAKSSTPISAAGVHSAGIALRPRLRGMSISSNAFEKALQRRKQETLNRPRTTNTRRRQSGGFGAMIRKTNEAAQITGLRSTASTIRTLESR